MSKSANGQTSVVTLHSEGEVQADLSKNSQVITGDAALGSGGGRATPSVEKHSIQIVQQAINRNDASKHELSTAFVFISF